MKRMKLLMNVLIIGLLACSEQYPAAENPLDAGREFIESCLKGDFKRASFYMLKDAENTRNLREIEKDYNSKSMAEQKQYSTASIIINEDAALSDTVHIINYSNSFDKLGRKIKVIYRDDKWQVDFKYTFNGNL